MVCHCNFVLVAALRFAPEATIDVQPEFDAVASKGSGLDIRNNSFSRGENYILADEDKPELHTFVDDQITAIVGEKTSQKLMKPKSVRADEVEEPNVDVATVDKLKEKFKEGVQYQEQRSDVLTDTVSHTVDPSGTTDLPNSLTTSVNTSQQVSTSPESSTCTSDDTDSATSPNVSRDISGNNSNNDATCGEGTSGVTTDSYSGEDQYTATETAPVYDMPEQMSTTEGDSYSTSKYTSMSATSGQFSDCVPSDTQYSSNNDISVVYSENCSTEESHATSTLDEHTADTSSVDGKGCGTADDGSSLERQSSGFHTAPQSAEDLHCSVTSEAQRDNGTRTEVYETSIDNGKY